MIQFAVSPGPPAFGGLVRSGWGGGCKRWWFSVSGEEGASFPDSEARWKATGPWQLV